MPLRFARRLLFLIALGFGGVACDRAPAPQAAAPAPREVGVVQVHKSDFPVRFEFVGRTESSQRVEIRARIDGYLDEIAYEEGAFVEEGDVLFRIDPAPFESRLRAAEAELAQQQARLDNAEALLARIEPLAEMDAVAEKELDDARGRVSEAAAAVEAASAGVYDAQLNLGYATITSPSRGLTSSAAQREGAYISGLAGSLTYVARIDPIWVEFTVSETQLLRSGRAVAEGKLREPDAGQYEVTLELADGTRYPHTGRISFADASVSTSTGSMMIRAELPNPEELLRPGQYVRVHVGGALRPDVATVPKRSVLEGSKGAYVWLVNDDGLAEQRPVVTGPWHEDDWVIESGLDADDRVIVSGVAGLRPGAPVTIGRIHSPGDAGTAP